LGGIPLKAFAETYLKHSIGTITATATEHAYAQELFFLISMLDTADCEREIQRRAKRSGMIAANLLKKEILRLLKKNLAD